MNIGKKKNSITVSEFWDDRVLPGKKSCSGSGPALKMGRIFPAQTWSR